MSKNIVVFGGSFDPIHRGHIALIKSVFMSIPNISLFYIIPAGFHPECKSYMFDSRQRLIMIKSCFEILKSEDMFYIQNTGGDNFISKPEFEDTRIIVSDFEVYSSEISYTYYTISHLFSENKDSVMHLVLGFDQAHAFSEWFHAKDISEIVSLWTFPRENYKPDPAFFWNFIESESYFISSSFIREQLLLHIPLNTNEVPVNIQILAPLFFNYNLDLKR